MANGGVEWNARTISYRAGANLLGALGLAVKRDAANGVIPVTAITDRVAGIVRDVAPLDGTVVIYTGGIVPVKVNAAGIAAGDTIGITADGKGKKIVPGTDTTQYIIGVAEEASAAADDIISVRLDLSGRAV